MKFRIAYNSLLIPTYLLLINSVHVTKGENILFYWAVSGTSHRITVNPLVEKLVEKGHNVTFLSPMPPKKTTPKVHEVIIKDLFDNIGLGVDFVEARIQGGAPAISKLWSTYFDFAIDSCEYILGRPELVDWINSSSFDLIIINAMFNDCAFGLVYKFKVPHIIYGTTHGFGWFSEAYGYPDEIGYPEFMYHYPEDMNFLQSVHNALQPLYWQWYRHTYMFPRIETILRKSPLNIPEMPSIAEMEQNVSLIFLNTHWSEEHPRSLPPLFVPIGGMHCVDNIKPLPEELERFIRISDEGFLYFSFGTFANPESLPRSMVDTIFNTMGNITRVQFLVRWVDDSVLIVPKNVKLVKWVDQQSILAHPKIKAFISHGGLLGTQEAVCHHCPSIIIPLFAEQDYNAERVHSRGRGIALNINTLNQDILTDAIHEILRNSSYAENTLKVSKLFRDRPMKPVDTAIWWVEFVLRHKDTQQFLHPVGMKRNWFERRLLHIWLFLTCCGIMLLVISGIVMQKLYKLIVKGDTKEGDKKEKAH